MPCFFLDSWIDIPINSRVWHGLQQTLYFRATTHYTTSNEYIIYPCQNHHFSKKFAATAKIGFYAIITQINTLSLYFQLQNCDYEEFPDLREHTLISAGWLRAEGYDER